MKKNIMIMSIVLLAVANVFMFSYTLDIRDKYEKLKTRLDVVNRNRIGATTLKVGESTDIELDNKEYSLKLIRIIKDPPCISTGMDDTTNCVRTGEYDISFSINGIVFALDSGLNYSSQIITTDFVTSYVIYYVPEYNDREATFFIEKDVDYKKETHLIVGNYIVYVDEDYKVIDINTFSAEEQTWGRKYVGMSLENIKELIKNGELMGKAV